MSKFDQYRADVERRDRRFLWVTRSMTAFVGALLVWLAVWSSGFDHALTNWITSRSNSTQVVAVSRGRAKAPRPPPQILGKTRVESFGGLRSSVSTTPRSLVLTGTMPGRNSHEGVAFIGVDAHHPQTYSAGALLANGARLTQIFPRYVLLEKGSKLARLYLGGGSQIKRNSEASLLTVGGPQTSRPAVANVHEEFTEFIRETPVYGGLAVRGFQVYPGTRGGVFARMGLQPGDLITSVDGAPLTDPAEAVAVFRQLAAGTLETVEVIRGGKSVTVTLDGSLMAKEREREREREAVNGSTSAGVPSI